MLTERRKADRALMAGEVAELARQYGLDNLTTGEQHGSRATSVTVTGPHGLKVNVSFSGISNGNAPDTYILCWHGVEPRWRLQPGKFWSVNEYHGHKATDIVHGFTALLALLGRRFAAIEDGSAFIPSPGRPEDP